MYNLDKMGVDDKKLISRIWKLADQFRGEMPFYDFRDYFLGLVFYKIISDQVTRLSNSYLTSIYDKDTEVIIDNEKFEKELENYQLFKLGYSIERKHLFGSLIESRYWDDYSLEFQIKENLNVISKNLGYGGIDIFKGVISNLNKYQMNRNTYALINTIEEIFTYIEQNERINYGDIFIRLIEEVAVKSAKIGSGIITPVSVSRLIAKLLNANVKSIKQLYDPTYGCGSLILSVCNQIPVDMIFGQEINLSNFNLARMNLIIRGVHKSKWNIGFGDSLLNPQYIDVKFDAIVCHPPFNMKWNNQRWLYTPIPPKNTADMAFVQHMLYHLDKKGTMIVVLPHGALFRGNVENLIRAQFIDNKYLDAIIGLPTNLFYETNIPTCILIFKKARTCNDILFIDASMNFKKSGFKNILSDEDIDKIIDVYNHRCELDGYSAKVSKECIMEKDYNLSIHKYIDIFNIKTLIKNYNFNKFSLYDISKIERYKDNVDGNFLLLRPNNPKVININDENFNKSLNYISITPDEKIVSVEYLEYFFDTHISQSLFKSISSSITQHISINELKELKIPIPDIEIQKQILQSQNQISDTIKELKDYRDGLVNNPNKVNDLSYKLKELRVAIKTNTRRDHIKREIERGESIYVEFKRDFSKSAEKIIRTIYSFLNTQGGIIYVGVEDDGSICGLYDHEKFKNDDELVLKFTNKFRDKIPQYLGNVDVEAVNVDSKKILVVKCKKSETPAIRRNEGKTFFYIRKNKSTQVLDDIEEIIKYVKKNFVHNF